MLSVLAVVVMTGFEPSASDLSAKFRLVDDAGPMPAQYAGWSRRQLDAELERLDNLRPSLGGPIALMVSGVVLAAGDVVVLLFAGLFTLVGRNRIDTGLIIGMSIVGVIAAGLIIVGGILLGRITSERNVVGREMDLVKAAIDALVPLPTPAPGPNAPPPVPPATAPYPLQVMAPLSIAVTLARF